MGPPPYRPHTAPIPPGLLQSAPGRTKEEGGMKNAESRGRLCPAMRENHALPRAIPKPHQCDIKATSKRVDSQADCDPKATPKPPQCDPKATLRRPQGSHKAPTKPGDGPRTTDHGPPESEGRRQSAHRSTVHPPQSCYERRATSGRATNRRLWRQHKSVANVRLSRPN